MKYLPFENITYLTQLSPMEIRSKLQEVTEPKQMLRLTGFWSKGDHKAYEGSIDPDRFRISRIINYRNSFLPRIEGTIEPGFNKTSVHVKMRLHPLVYIFLIVWFGGLFIGTGALIANTSGEETFDPAVLVPLIMLLFGYGLTTGGFKYESLKSKAYLAELLEASIED